VITPIDDLDSLRTPPHDIPAEQAVLGSMLLSGAVIPDVAEKLKPDHFYRPGHQTLFEVICDLFNRGEPADAITTAEELQRRNLLARTGGPLYLHTLIEAVPSVANAAWYAGIIKGHALRRSIIEVGGQITQIGWTGDGPAAELADRAQAAAWRLGSDRGSDTMVRVGEILNPSLEEIAAIGSTASTDRLVSVPTGFADLDELLNGLHGGQLVVIGARPALGKSTLSLDIVRCAAIRHGLPAVMFSLEMGRLEIVMRLISAEARVPLHALRSGQLSEDDWDRIAKHLPDIREAPLWIDDSAVTSLMEIRGKCRRLKQRHDLRLVVVDYLQLMTAPRPSINRQQEVSEMSRTLKLIAKELEVPVVALSQLNRGPEQRQDKKPMLSDLRESGAVEQDADVVIFIHREDAYERESPRAGEADLIVAKHRNGPTATVTVAFQGHYSRFVDMAPA
jgi:replicative DNA helicase